MHGKRIKRTVWKTVQVPIVVTVQVPGVPGPCYPDPGGQPAAFWDGYRSSALAILTLAHESIHLGGVQGTTLSNGRVIGDPLAEAKANCYGMQWVPYVAQQLARGLDG